MLELGRYILELDLVCFTYLNQLGIGLEVVAALHVFLQLLELRALFQSLHSFDDCFVLLRTLTQFLHFCDNAIERWQVAKCFESFVAGLPFVMNHLHGLTEEHTQHVTT